MTIEEIIKKLNLTEYEVENNSKDNSYTIRLKDSNDYSKVYTILDKSDDFDLDVDKMLLNENVSEFIYLCDDYDVKLIANLSEDKYKVIIEEAKD